MLLRIYVADNVRTSLARGPRAAVLGAGSVGRRRFRRSLWTPCGKSAIDGICRVRASWPWFRARGSWLKSRRR